MSNRRACVFVLLVAAGLSLAFLGGARPADALQAGCVAFVANGGTTVSTVAEINAAVDCYNAALPADAGDYVIDLAADLAFGAEGLPAISQSESGFSLTISGAGGFTMTSSEVVPIVTVGADAIVVLQEIEITGAGAAGSVAISNTGELLITDSHIVSGGTAIESESEDAELDVSLSTIVATEVGIRTSGTTDIARSTVAGLGSSIGIDVRNGIAVVDNTTLSDHGTGVLVDDLPGALVSVRIVGSTFVDNTVGIDSRLDPGAVTMSNSTISGTETAVLQSAGEVSLFNSTVEDVTAAVDATSGFVKLESALVNGTCSFDQSEIGSSVGSCFGEPVPLLPLADNGCVVDQARLDGDGNPVRGCVNTHQLIGLSDAFGGGNCEGVRVFDPVMNQFGNGDLTLDQIGVARTPTGALGCDAGAVEGFDCDRLSFTVATEDELNLAIFCYNAATTEGDYTITLANDIALGQTPIAVTTNPARSELTIDGQGHRLSGGAGIDGLDIQSGVPVTVTDLVVSDVRRGIVIQDGDVIISPAVTISQVVVTGAEAAALDVENFDASARQVIIERSFVDGADVGIRALGAEVLVDASTIVNTTTGVDSSESEIEIRNSTVRDAASVGVAVGSPGASVVVASSTIDGAPVGVRGESALIVVTNSTLENDTDVSVDEPSSVAIANSSLAGGDVAIVSPAANVTVVSSVVNGTCAALGDDGTNVGSCFGGDDATLAPLADNGCVTEQVVGFVAGVAGEPSTITTGCVETRAIDAGSAALGVGTCSQVPVGLTEAGEQVLEDLATDQRGDPRTPVGAVGCDAGAYEFDCAQAPSTVATEDDLNLAIFCYNAAETAADVTITIAGDIALVATPTTVTQAAADFALTIDGDGHRLSGDAGIDGLVVESRRPVTITDLVIVDVNEGIVVDEGDVVISEVVIVGAATTAVRAEDFGSGTTVLIERSFFDDVNFGVRVFPQAQVTVDSSTISNVHTGVSSALSRVVIRNTTIRDASVAGATLGSPGASLLLRGSTIEGAPVGVSVGTNAARSVITNSTLSNDTNVVVADLVSLSIANSTLDGGQTAIDSVAANVDVVSSVVNGACGAIDDEGANVGSCFGGGDATLAPLADNGCGAEQAVGFVAGAAGQPSTIDFGCVETRAITVDSPAFGAGTCTDVPIALSNDGALTSDQRGEPRTPAGAIGCDAGSFEVSERTVTISVDVADGTPNADWSVRASAARPCFIANPGIVEIAGLVAAGGGSFSFELYEGCSVTAMVDPQPGFEVAPTDVVQDVAGDVTIGFVASPVVPPNVVDATIVGDADCSGEVDIVDAMVTAQFEVAVRPGELLCGVGAQQGSDAISTLGADVNDDGRADIVDALIIARCVAGFVEADWCVGPGVVAADFGDGPECDPWEILLEDNRCWPGPDATDEQIEAGRVEDPG
ncbi:MAG: right-handed parallel beta-helix repeat-containing protein [Actinomycetota bacterium]